jgi:DHA1 family multidrug resistance protein-like MFS transporter
MGPLGGFTAVALALASLSAPPESLTRAIARAQSTPILGFMVGPALGGLLADHFGLRAAFVGSRGLAMIAGLNRLLVYHEPRAAAPQRKTRPKASLQALLRTPGFAPILVVLCAGSFTDRSYQPLIPLLVVSLAPADGAAASLTSLIGAGGALAAALSANAASHLLPRFTPAQVLWAALVACICGAALLALRHTVWQLGLLRVAVGLLAGGILTLAYVLGGDDRADRAAVERVWRAEQWGDGRIGPGPHHGWHAGSGQPAWRRPVEYWHLLHRFARAFSDQPASYPAAAK